MTHYPTLSDIEFKWRASGSGICLIVEGETELDDPWFYQQWFGNESRRFTFFPQDGWAKVEEAVATLRSALGARKVYGIVDRDFEPLVSYPPLPANGILRTTKYTLENYLLDPRCWFSYIQPHIRRTPRPGWNTVEETRGTLHDLYRRCLPLSAYNWTLRETRRLNEIAFEALPEKDRQYREHPKSLENVEPTLLLKQIQASMGLADDLASVYQGRLAQLQAMSFEEWPQWVSGKYVLKALKESFPIRPVAWDDVLSAYMSLCYAPPTDITNLLEFIWLDASA